MIKKGEVWDWIGVWDGVTVDEWAVWNATAFNNSLGIENLSFAGNDTIIRYLNVPQNTTVINAYINFSGYTGSLNSTHTCYQEFANVSTVCGGINTGNYLVTNDSNQGYFYINYTKPINFIGALWQVKHGNNSQNIQYNITIPDDCINSTLQL